jgi:glyoxalase family protein
VSAYGIHHVSAITKDIIENHDFFTEFLGHRLVKKTVNQDSTDMYHLFYSDYKGTPGTDVTFFEIGLAPKFTPGTNSISRTFLRVPTAEAIEYFRKRMDERGVYHEGVIDYFGETMMKFSDEEGQRFALVADPEYNDSEPYAGGGTIPAEYAITAIFGVELTVQYLKPMVQFLQMLGGEYIGDIDNDTEARVRFGQDSVFVVESRTTNVEKQGYGSVHHFALRVKDEADLKAIQERVTRDKWRSSGIVDRHYFKALYISAVGNITVEISTDTPGFTVDEPLETLGENLSLPPFLEEDRDFIEMRLHPLN